MNLTEELKKDWLVLLLLALPFVVLGIVWQLLPEQLPLHWNASGEIDRVANKSSKEALQVFIIPFTTIFVYFIMLVVPSIDPKQKIEQFRKTYQLLKLLVVAFMNLIFLMLILVWMGVPLDVPQIVFFLVGLLFVVLGNYFSKVRPNYFVGFRTPWTLENEEVWRKTHRMGAKLWMVAGLLMMLSLFFLAEKWMVFLIVGITLLISIVPIVYSYQLFNKMKQRE